MSNREFSLSDRGFRELCKLAGVEPTKRQASKFKNRKGSAYRQQQKMMGR